MPVKVLRRTPSCGDCNVLHGNQVGTLTVRIVPSRENGLFPPGDPLLLQLASEAHTHPFEKHLAGETLPYELLNNGSWTSGDEACQAGFDLRLFYRVGSYALDCRRPDIVNVNTCSIRQACQYVQEHQVNEVGTPRGVQQHQYGTVVGAARLGERASIGNGYWMSAHGGAARLSLSIVVNAMMIACHQQCSCPFSGDCDQYHHFLAAYTCGSHALCQYTWMRMSSEPEVLSWNLCL